MISIPKIVFLLIAYFTSNTLYCQKDLVALIRPAYANLLVNVDNYLFVVAQQKQPIKLDQIKAEYYRSSRPLAISNENGYFTIKPDSAGEILITLSSKKAVYRERLRAIEIPAVPYLGNFNWDGFHKLSVNEMKLQRGIFPVVENYGFDIKCSIKSFEFIRVSKGNTAMRTLNEGGSFNEQSREIINATSTGDVFIFRNIMCKCPGNNFPQRLEDKTLEIE